MKLSFVMIFRLFHGCLGSSNKKKTKTIQVSAKTNSTKYRKENINPQDNYAVSFYTHMILLMALSYECFVNVKCVAKQ